MPQYDKSKGKAFSYFSILTKNYLILENNEEYKSRKINCGIESDPNFFNIVDEEQHKTFSNEIPEYIRLMIEYWDNNLQIIFNKQYEIRIADSILTLFKRSNSIENFNKKQLYLMVREMTGIKTQQITPVINKMKHINKLLIDKYNKSGYFEVNTYFKIGNK